MTDTAQYIRNKIAALGSIYDESEARWLMRIIFEHLKGWTQADILLNADKPVSEQTEADADKIVTRLLKHEPIQYIIGETYWHGITLKVSPAVLIPREETSELVDIIVNENNRADLNILDICTGSGCIAIALAKNIPFANVTATDISQEALDVAKVNADMQKVKIDFRREDALKPTTLPSAGFDVIVSNPPYICQSESSSMDKNVLDYEPHTALFVPDDDPFKFYRPIAANAIKLLHEGGRLYFEINPLHCEQLCDMLTYAGWENVLALRDMHGKNRFISATSPA